MRAWQTRNTNNGASNTITDVYFDDLRIDHRSVFVTQATDYGAWGDVIREQKADVENIFGSEQSVSYEEFATCDFNNYSACGWTEYGDNMSLVIIEGGRKLQITIAPCSTGVCNYQVVKHLDTDPGEQYKVTFDLNIGIAEEVEVSIWSHKATGSAPLGPQQKLESVTYSQSNLPIDGKVTIEFTATNTSHSSIYIRRTNPETINQNEYLVIDNMIVEHKVITETTQPDMAGIYRWGYQGQFAEKDDETGWSHFELREYDPIIGRWLVPDPYGEFWSPYLAQGNNPVNKTDPDGGCTSGNCPDKVEVGDCHCSYVNDDGDRVTEVADREEYMLMASLFDESYGDNWQDRISNGDLWLDLGKGLFGVGSFPKDPFVNHIAATVPALPISPQGGVAVTSALLKSPRLIRSAFQAWKSNSKGFMNLLREAVKGNLNPGIGTKTLKSGIHYFRHKDGARIFFRNTDDGIEIIGYANKSNEATVISEILKLY